MFTKSFQRGIFCLVVCLLFLAAGFTSISAQTEDEVKEALVKGLYLFEQKRYVEAVPHLELLVKVMPDQAKLRFLYGFSMVAKSKQIDDAEMAKELSAKALEEFKAAKKFGMNDPMNESLIKMLSGDRSVEDSAAYSKNAEANKLVNNAENSFAQSKYDEAITLFQKALALDPNIYQAAVSLGDCYVFKKDWENAEKSYQKAIAINPMRETAYRYSATPFMRQEKYEQARDRYIEAFITEPYSRMSPGGISQWAEVTETKIGHPEIEFPELKFDEKGEVVMAASGNNPNFNGEWKEYIRTRTDWRKNKFAKAFPAQKQYRHSLQEETDAVRNLLKLAKEQKLSNSQFDILQKLDDEGLLESYILMAQPDEGIAQDHEEYLKTNRAKMRQYILNYFIKSK